MNSEKKRLNKFLLIIDNHIHNVITGEGKIDSRDVGGLFDVRSEIIRRLNEISKKESFRKTWEEFRNNDRY